MRALLAGRCSRASWVRPYRDSVSNSQITYKCFGWSLTHQDLVRGLVSHSSRYFFVICGSVTLDRQLMSRKSNLTELCRKKPCTQWSVPNQSIFKTEGEK